MYTGCLLLYLLVQLVLLWTASLGRAMTSLASAENCSTACAASGPAPRSGKLTTARPLVSRIWNTCAGGPPSSRPPLPLRTVLSAPLSPSEVDVRGRLDDDDDDDGSTQRLRAATSSAHWSAVRYDGYSSDAPHQLLHSVRCSLSLSWTGSLSAHEHTGTHQYPVDRREEEREGERSSTHRP